MSENLRLLGEYSAAMDKGDTEAVFAFFAPEFTSHVTAGSTPTASATTSAATSNAGGPRCDRRSPT